MNVSIDRLPALPLIANDPYFSIWMPGDTLTSACPIHWSGAPKHLDGHAVIDGKEYVFLGQSSRPAMATKALHVTPTRMTVAVQGICAEITLQQDMLSDGLLPEEAWQALAPLLLIP